MKKKYGHLLFWFFILILIIGLIYSILNFETPEEYVIEFKRLQAECDARTPEGYICLVDYFPQPPYIIMYSTAIILLLITYFIDFKTKIIGD